MAEAVGASLELARLGQVTNLPHILSARSKVKPAACPYGERLTRQIMSGESKGSGVVSHAFLGQYEPFPIQLFSARICWRSLPRSGYTTQPRVAQRTLG